MADLLGERAIATFAVVGVEGTAIERPEGYALLRAADGGNI
jgi:hypothetical protein